MCTTYMNVRDRYILGISIYPCCNIKVKNIICGCLIYKVELLHSWFLLNNNYLKSFFYENHFADSKQEGIS